MTKFGEEVVFSPECLTKFFRLPISCDDNTFLINTGRNSLCSIQVHDQKILKTWTLTHPHSFTSPVAFCAADNTVSCVLDNNVLMTWPYSTEDLSSAVKIKLNCSIFAVLPVEKACTVVVFTSGNASLIEEVASDSAILPAGSKVLDPDEELTWADASLNAGDVIIVYVTKNKKSQVYRLLSFRIQSSERTIIPLISQSLSRDSVSLKCWCLSTGLGSPSLLTIWSDGEVHAFDLAAVKYHFLFAVSNVCSESSIAIDTIGRSHLAVSKITSTRSKEAVLEIWDLKYFVQKAVKVLKNNVFKNMQMKTFKSSIFLMSSEGVILIPIELDPSTLSSVLGKSVSYSKDCTAKSFKWTSDGDLTVEKPSSSENEKCTTYCSPYTNFTSKMFEEIVSKLSSDEVETFCNEFSELKDIPEEELVKMLQMCLIMLNKEKIEGRNLFHADILLNGIFKIQFNHLFLIQCLKSLSFKEALIALHFLHKLFQSELFCGKTSQRPSDLQVLNWIDLLLQSHCDDLVVSKDKSILKLLQKLQFTLAEKIDVYTELEEIDNLIKLLKKKHGLPEKSMNSKYCIETLVL